MRPGLLLVRGIATVDGYRVPANVPAGWTLHPQSGGWSEARRDSDGLLLAAWLANTNADDTRGLWAVLCEDRALLDTWAAASDRAWTLRELIADVMSGDATARAVLRRWRMFRCSGTFDDGELSRGFTDEAHALIEEGETLPDFLPSAGTPWVLGPYTVTDVLRPAMTVSMAGPWNDAADMEATT